MPVLLLPFRTKMGRLTSPQFGGNWFRRIQNYPRCETTIKLWLSCDCVV